MKRLGKSVLTSLYRSHLISCALKKHTIQMYTRHLKEFFLFLKSRYGIADIREVGTAQLKGYLTYLNEERKCERKEGLLAEGTKKLILGSLKGVFNFLYANEYILSNPAEELVYKRSGGARLRLILSQEEMSKVLDAIDISSPRGLRDRAIFELLYSAGLRMGELRRLKISDFDFSRRMVVVLGKGEKHRMVPVSEVAVKFLLLYLGSKKHRKGEYLFPGQGGRPLNGITINKYFRMWAEAAGIKRKGLSVHCIRHSVSTHLLENGAGIRYVQDFLGHESIETTTIYTHMLYDNLKRIYRSYHPRENEYYRELDEEYRKRIALFVERLKKRKQVTDRGRAYMKAHHALQKERKKGKIS